jgi:hypothetical protein
MVETPEGKAQVSIEEAEWYRNWRVRPATPRPLFRSHRTTHDGWARCLCGLLVLYSLGTGEVFAQLSKPVNPHPGVRIRGATSQERAPAMKEHIEVRGEEDGVQSVLATRKPFDLKVESDTMRPHQAL